MTALPVTPCEATTYRLINSRYPTVSIFDDLDATEEEIRAGFAFEALTNDRISAVAHDRLQLLPPDSVLTGPTATLAMAAFLHANPEGGRFTDGRLGAWYAALDVETALAEVLYHNHRRLTLSEAGFPNRIQLRQLIAEIKASLTDIRLSSGADADQVASLMKPDPGSYSQSQSFGTSVRWPFAQEGSDGIVYTSVRRAAGTNVCIFRPTCIALPVNQGDHFQIDWDRQGNSMIHQLVQVS